MKSENLNHIAVEQNFAALRRAIEDRTYDELDRLLAEQRILIGNLTLADPEAQEYFVQAQDLTAWSLKTVRMHRSVLEREIADVNRSKQIQESYGGAALAGTVKSHF
jgi:hypothetical protein